MSRDRAADGLFPLPFFTLIYMITYWATLGRYHDLFNRFLAVGELGCSKSPRYQHHCNEYRRT